MLPVTAPLGTVTIGWLGFHSIDDIAISPATLSQRPIQAYANCLSGMTISAGKAPCRTTRLGVIATDLATGQAYGAD